MQRPSVWRYLELAATGTVTLLIAFMSAVVVQNIVQHNLDTFAHVRYAEMTLETGRIVSPHFVYQGFMLGLQAVTGVPMLQSAMAVLIIYMIVTLLIISFWLQRSTSESNKWLRLGVPFIALTLLFIHPLSGWIPPGNHYYGYIALNAYHNPTMTVMKPFAILHFILVTAMFSRKPDQRGYILITVLTAIMATLAALSKPSYVICVVPLVGLWWLYQLVRRKPAHHAFVFFGTLIPILAIIVWQTAYTYFDRTFDIAVETVYIEIEFLEEGETLEPSSIIFKPFDLYTTRYDETADPRMRNLFPKFVLSIIFPLLVYALHFPSARKNQTLNLAWLLAGVGLFYVYFFSETGYRATHGNFVWSGQIALFILVIVSVLYLLQLYGVARRRVDWRLGVVVAVYGLYLISGLHWYYYHAFSDPGLIW